MSALAPATTFYLDESGNTGDLARAGTTMSFGGQATFTLASIGVRDVHAIGVELERLRQRHRVQAQELKSSTVRSKPELVGELVSFLREHELPVLIEVVDKRFMIAANMISFLVMPIVGACDTALQTQWFRNELAEYVYERGPVSLVARYVAACDAPSATTVTGAFEALLDWLDTRDGCDHLAEALRFFTRDSFEDFKAAGVDSDVAQRRCLPPPDLGKKGQSIWMLPNLTSLTNVYARINRYCRGRLADIVIIHDEQAHFDEILTDAKAVAERLAREERAMPARFANYDFVEQAVLRFARSDDTPGIQAADIIAGFVMRYVDSVLRERTVTDPSTSEVFGALVDLADPDRGLGINFVLASRDIVRLGVQPI